MTSKTEQAYIDMRLDMRLDEAKKNAKLVFNRVFGDVAKDIMTLKKSINALAKADEDMDLHDQVVSMEKHLGAVEQTARKASKIIKGM
jgi:hypothetical protein